MRKLVNPVEYITEHTIMCKFYYVTKHHVRIQNFWSPMQMLFLKPSSVGAVNTEAGRAFQMRIVEGKKELL